MTEAPRYVGLVYVISDATDGKIKYVGKTTGNLKRRLTFHLNDRDSKIGCFIKNHKEPKWLGIQVYWVTEKYDLSKVEKHLIQKYNPEYNTQLIKEDGNPYYIDFWDEEDELDFLRTKHFDLLSILPRRRKPNPNKQNLVISRIIRLLSINPEEINKDNWTWVKQEIKDIAKEMERVKM